MLSLNFHIIVSHFYKSIRECIMVTEAAVTDRGKYKRGTVSNLHSRET